jgi:hypothetical protein
MGDITRCLTRRNKGDKLRDILWRSDCGFVDGEGLTPPIDNSEDNSSDSGLNLVCDIPEDLSIGDLLLVVVVSAGNTINQTPPLGWSNIFQDYGTGCTISVFYKVAVLADTLLDTFTFTVGTLGAIYVNTMRITGAAASLVQAHSKKTEVIGKFVANTVTGITTTAANCLLIAISCVADGVADFTGKVPSGWKTHAIGRANVGSSTGLAVGIWYRNKLSIGATGDVTIPAVGLGPNTDNHTSALIAIEAA